MFCWHLYGSPLLKNRFKDIVIYASLKVLSERGEKSSCSVMCWLRFSIIFITCLYLNDFKILAPSGSPGLFSGRSSHFHCLLFRVTRKNSLSSFSSGADLSLVYRSARRNLWSAFCRSRLLHSPVR